MKYTAYFVDQESTPYRGATTSKVEFEEPDDEAAIAVARKFDTPAVSLWAGEIRYVATIEHGEVKEQEKD